MCRKEENFDVIIIGGGPAGLSAALWCAELGLDSIVLEKKAELGGQLHWIHTPIRNYPGIEATSGSDFLSRFVEQLGRRNFEIRNGANIVDVDLQNRVVTLANGETVRSRFLIISTGIRRRNLGVEGEREFAGRGILETGQIDRHLLRGKRLMIVGGGDAAFENAAALSEYAKRVFLLHRRSEFAARKEFVDRVKSNRRTELITNGIVKTLSGDSRLESVEYLDLRTGTRLSIGVDALLVRIGVEPNTELFHGRIDLDDAGYIRVRSTCETSVPGIYAVGDVANPISPTISTAIGNGSTAAKQVAHQLARLGAG